MEHAEARELLDLAAVEPGGLDRLMAGDTPTAHALAGHLAGCDACTAEFGRLRTSAEVLHGVIATMPPPELRERTLAFVAAVGRPRGAVGAGATSGPPVAEGGASAASTTANAAAPPGDASSTAVAGAVGPAAAPVKVVQIPLASRSQGRARGIGRIAWLAAAAALVIATAGSTAYVVSTNADGSVRQAAHEIDGLSEVAAWTVRLDAEPDVRHVTLTSAPASGAMNQIGTLEFSAAAMQVVVVADGVADPPAGQEYRCWVEVGGTRQRLGRMESIDGLAYWVGDAAVLSNIPAGSVFGVSLADVNSTGGANPPILSGTLQAT